MRMTELSVSKFIFVAAAGLALLTFGGCDRASGVVAETLHKIKTVPVDANDHSVGTPDDRKLDSKDVALLFSTAIVVVVMVLVLKERRRPNPASSLGW